MTQPSTRKSLGFTLLELLVVMVLIGLITAVAVPVAGAGIQTLRLQSGARHVAAALRLARGRAIRSQEIHLVSLDREQRRVTVSSGDLRFQRTFQLPPGVQLQEALLLDGTPPRPARPMPERIDFYFSPSGLSQALEVRLVNARGRSLRVVQQAFSRSPRILQAPSAEN
ncbi:MAG: prepilin-type N-terminal cleavage/methylation domain-containing protein [Acidobacteria bacterium]|nr:prepilin-type N-terminal cleavage/methylation domain-containing protein [Acidobacteriota bacterium]